MMHRSHRYTKNVQSPKTQQRRVWKSDNSYNNNNNRNKTIGTTSRGKFFSRNKDNNSKSDTRRFITKKLSASSHGYRYERDEYVNDGYNDEVDRYYENDYEYEYEDDYIYDENYEFENEYENEYYDDEDFDVYNNNQSYGDGVYTNGNYGNGSYGRYGDTDGRYSNKDSRYGNRGGRSDDKVDRYDDKDSHYDDKGDLYDERNSCYRDGDSYHNDNNNRNGKSSYSNIPVKYEREFFSSAVRKQSRNSLDTANAANAGKRDVRSRLGPRSPVEHEEKNLDVGYDDSYMDDPQVIYNHPSSFPNNSSRNRLDSPEDSRYNVVDHGKVEDIEQDHRGTCTAENRDKQVTKALLDEFGVSITDIADYLRRQIAEKQKNGDLTLNQLLEDKFLNDKSTTTGKLTRGGTIETSASSSSSGKEKKRSISPELIFDSTSKSEPLKRGEGKRKSQSSSKRTEYTSRKAEPSTMKYNSHNDMSRTISPHSKKNRHSRPSEKDYGKRSRSPDGKYHTVRLKDGERKSSYSPERKSHRTRRLSSSERESSELKKQRSYDDRRVNSNTKKTSSIEEFLINAGNQGVNEFKKQQASRFIASKLQPAHFQTLKPAIVFPVPPPLVISQHHVVVATPPLPPPIKKPTITSPVFIPINTSLPTSDFLPLDTKNDIPMKQNIGTINRDTKVKQTDTTSKESTSSSINETLSLLRKSSSSAAPQEAVDTDKSVNVDKKETNEVVDINGTNDESENDSSSDDEVSITRVVEPKKKTKTLIQPVVAPTKPNETQLNKNNTANTSTVSGRKVFLEGKNNKVTTASEGLSTSETNYIGKETGPKTRVRVPSWFNTRLVELFKKRHKKVQQLKRAKQDPSGVANNSNRVKELQDSIRDIDREYIPLCQKTKQEFMKNGGTSSSSSRSKYEIAILGFDESMPDSDVPALF